MACIFKAGEWVLLNRILQDKAMLCQDTAQEKCNTKMTYSLYAALNNLRLS